MNHARRIFIRKYCSSVVKWPRQVLSAIQPTGKIHLGNYLGVIRKWIDLQKSEENPVIFGIADLHSITLPQDPHELNQNILITAATLMACGIDPRKSILFLQSSVPLHSQLCWILATLTSMPRLSQLPQFKEKSAAFNEIPVGIFLYPVLQAADIMLYKGNYIPVGEDQTQHIHLVNHLIRLFNGRFGDTFPRVDAIIDSAAGRIKSLTDPTKKMSKSDPKDKSFICLMDEPDEILKKCKKAMTDFKSEVTFEGDARPGVSNLLLIHSVISGKTPNKIVEECTGMNTSQYKVILAELIIEHLKPISRKITEYLNAPEYLASELEHGSTKAFEIAEKTMKEVNHKIGLDIFSLKMNNLKSVKI